MREFIIEKKLRKTLVKLRRKDSHKYGILIKKISEIVNSVNANHYKNLRKPYQHLKRVHVNSHFVLVFEYEKKNNLIIFLDFDHHDNVYR